MNRRMTGHDQSLNNPFSADNEDEWINSLVDDKESHRGYLQTRTFQTQRKCLKALLKT